MLYCTCGGWCRFAVQLDTACNQNKRHGHIYIYFKNYFVYMIFLVFVLVFHF